MSFGKFMAKYYGLFVISGITIASFTIAAVTMVNSKKEYDEYLKEYEANANEIKAKYPQLPQSIFFDNDFVTYDGDDVASSKSTYRNSLVLFARDAKIVSLGNTKKPEFKVLIDDPSEEEIKEAEYTRDEYLTGLDKMGGEINFTINTETYGMTDIEIQIRTNWFNKAGEYQEIENITDKISIQVNKLEVKTENVTLVDDREEFQSLILKDTFLVKGENTLSLSTSAYNDLDTKDDCLYIMPDLRNVTIISDATLVAPDRTPEEVEE